MQTKHLIIFALVGIVLLLGFNMVNGNRNESNRAAVVNKMPASSLSNDTASTATNINSKPLGEQPKAIIDDATAQVEQAQQAEQTHLAQVDGT